MEAENHQQHSTNHLGHSSNANNHSGHRQIGYSSGMSVAKGVPKIIKK